MQPRLFQWSDSGFAKEREIFQAESKGVAEPRFQLLRQPYWKAVVGFWGFLSFASKKKPNRFGFSEQS